MNEDLLREVYFIDPRFVQWPHNGPHCTDYVRFTRFLPLRGLTAHAQLSKKQIFTLLKSSQQTVTLHASK